MASTNQTTHYELSQYIGTDKPTYLVDYNQDMSKIDAGIYAAKSEADTNTGSIGTLSSLTTEAKTSLVAAVNEVNSYTSSIGDLSDLDTSEQSNLVGAINEINSEVVGIGTLADLTTTAKNTVVAAINEVDGDIGTLSNLTTTVKTSTVAAINEIDGDIGTLSNLSTTAKNNTVAAINELYTSISNLESKFNLTTFKTYNTSQMSITGASFRSGDITIASNSDGSICKIYGRVCLTSNGSALAEITLANTGITVDEQFAVSPSGDSKGDGDNVTTITFNTDNTITLKVYNNPAVSNGGAYVGHFFPFIIFVKNFGDTE